MGKDHNLGDFVEVKVARGADLDLGNVGRPEPEVVCLSFSQLGRHSPTAVGNFLFLVSLLPPSPLPPLLPVQRSTCNAPVIDEVHRPGTNRWGEFGRLTLTSKIPETFLITTFIIF